MKQHRLLWIAVILLFLLNAGTLFLLLAPKADRRQPPGGGNKAFDERVVRTLSLDEAQQRRFEDMKRAHHQKMMALDQEMKQPFSRYFALLEQPAPSPAQKDSLEKIISGIYLQKVRYTYDHFNELKKSCRPDQQQQFGQLLPFLMQVITPQPPQGPPPQGPPSPPDRP